MSDQYVIIVAGGTGTRMNNDLPKQFIKVCGREIILHTIEKFLKYDPSIHIIIAVHPDFLDFLHTLLEKNNFKSIIVVKGGETRFHSVKNALSVITDRNALVGIHDAARPLVSIDTISRCFTASSEHGNGIPAVRLNESVREVTGNQNKAINRDLLRVIQTPQCFKVNEIQNAFETDYDPKFTDDASVLEAKGKSIFLVQGNDENIKITLPKDLLIAELFLKNE